VVGHIARKLPLTEGNRLKEVRLIGASGEQLGIMPLRQALDTAREQNLDLVEVAATATPPVCRLLDYGKFKYEQARKEREARRGQKATTIREMRLRPQINDHDLQAKLRVVSKMLDEGDKVKVSVLFRGREMAHPENGWKLIQKLVEILKGRVAIDRQPAMEGRRMIVILSPVRRTGAATEPAMSARGEADAKAEDA
jgi:translation initiation factor IF-3